MEGYRNISEGDSAHLEGAGGLQPASVIHFGQVLKAWWCESGRWEGSRCYLYYLEEGLLIQSLFCLLSIWMMSGMDKNILSRFLPQAFCCSTPSHKKDYFSGANPPSIIFRTHLGTSCTVRIIIPGFKPCLSEGRGYLEFFSASLCLLFALKVPTCARKNILSMLYMERDWENKAAGQRNDGCTR